MGRSGRLLECSAWRDWEISPQVLSDAGISPPLPERPNCDIAFWADEIGLDMPGGMDVVPLSSLEIKAWCDMMGETLSPWEFRALRHMSRAYCSGLKTETAPFDPLGCKVALASAGMLSEMEG